MSRRAGWSLVEQMLYIGLLWVLLASLIPLVDGVARHRTTMTELVDDLRRATDACDEAARLVRTSTAVLPASPGGLVRTGAGGLVVRRADGRIVALSVEQGGAVLRRWAPGGRHLELVEPRGRLQELACTWLPRERAWRLDVTAPARGGPAAPPVLSTAARVGADEP